VYETPTIDVCAVMGLFSVGIKPISSTLREPENIALFRDESAFLPSIKGLPDPRRSHGRG